MSVNKLKKALNYRILSLERAAMFLQSNNTEQAKRELMLARMRLHSVIAKFQEVIPHNTPRRSDPPLKRGNPRN